jgi:hypothetical protein
MSAQSDYIKEKKKKKRKKPPHFGTQGLEDSGVA